jgi:hypothetical protein
MSTTTRERKDTMYEFTFRLDFEDGTHAIETVAADTIGTAAAIVASRPGIEHVTCLGFFDHAPQVALSF